MTKIEFSLPRGNYPRLCLIGNSNVGKSSLTKLLLSHPKWYKGKIGKTAGSTVRLTIINDPALKYHVIDLPGFGHMTRLSRKSTADVQDQILEYIKLDKNNIFLTLMVVNIERLEDELEKWYFSNEETVPLSIEFIQYILSHEIPCLLILNKVDKLNKYKVQSAEEKMLTVLKDFEIISENPEDNPNFLGIIKTSAQKDIGINELKKKIRSLALKIDYKKFDSRKTLLDKPPIGKSTNPKKKKKPAKKNVTGKKKKKGKKKVRY